MCKGAAKTNNFTYTCTHIHTQACTHTVVQSHTHTHSLGEGEVDLTLLIYWQEKDNEVVSGLSLSDGRVQTDHKVHLSLVVVWEEEESSDGGERELVVKRLAM